MKWSILLGLLPSLVLFANPQGLDVHHGSATAQHHANHLHIKHSPNAILHWKDFSIAKHESVHFAQEHAKSAVLNRVTGKHCSHLLGKLTSNGAVFLINPNGVLIGANALIQTAGFLASTADLSNEDFLKGKEFLFTSPGNGEIINQGHISCPKGDIYLIAKTIRNEGKLTAEHVTFASAQEVLIRPEGKEVFIRLDLEEGQIENSGVIDALTIDLQTTSPYAKAINHTGHIEAKTIREENGHIYLVAEKGGTEVDGSLIAHDVRVLGKEVYLQESAYIDASGPTGGTVLVGGDYQGNNPDILNAQNTFVASGAKVRADSLEEGNGGKVIYWSDGVTIVCGETSARGGPKGGDGGFIEVSGKKNFFYQGVNDQRAPKGKWGMILFDPESNVTVSTAAIFNINAASPFAPTGDSANLPVATLQAALGSGNVTLTTSNAGGTQLGNLTFANNVTWANADFTCTVGNNALFNAGVTISNTGTGIFQIDAIRSISLATGATISNTGTGSIVLNANTAGTTIGPFIGITMIGGTLSTTSGGITLNATGGTTGSLTLDRGISCSASSLIQTTDGVIDITAKGTQACVLFTSAAVTSATGAIIIDATGSNNDGLVVSSSAGITSTGTGSNAAPITITADVGTGNLADCLDIRLNGFITTIDGPISITSTMSGTGINRSGLQIIQGGFIQSFGTGPITANVQSTGTSDNAGTLLLDGDIRVNNGNLSLTTTASGGSGSEGLRMQNNSDLITTSGSGNIEIIASTTGGGSNKEGVNITAGRITSTGTGSISVRGTSNASGASGNHGVTLTGSGSKITSTGADITITGEGGGSSFGNRGIFINAGADITLTGNGTITLNGTGGPGTNLTRGVFVNGSGTTITSSNGSISITGVAGGSGINADGVLIFSSALVTAGGSGNLTIIGTASPTGTTGNDGVLISTPVSSVNGTIQITGVGGGTGSDNRGVQLSSTGSVTSTSGSIVVNGTGSSTGTGTTNEGILITGAGASIMSNSGAITLRGTEGGGTLEGIHIDAGGAVSTLNGLILMVSSRDTLIENGSSVSAVGPLTLVVDNSFPVFPGIGPGAFNLDATSTLTSTGELRIYTARQSQNSILGLLNGVAFTPGTFDVNTATETWGIYFPNGLYGGQAFNFYYKDGTRPPPPPVPPGPPLITPSLTSQERRLFFENIAANLVQLADLLPVLKPQRLPFAFPNYHFQIEGSPDFSPYGSFIFEDDLYWIGEKH